jgi:hypothetical protein
MKSRFIKMSALSTVALLAIPALALASPQHIPWCPSVPELDAGTTLSALAVLGAGAALVIERIRRRVRSN